MREVELKAVVADPGAVRASLLAAGARRTFAGQMIDRRYDRPDYGLRLRDEIVRVRITSHDGTTEGRVDFKGPASFPDGFKVRDEIGSAVEDVSVVERVLVAAGLGVSREIEREVEVYELEGAVVRFEVYPRMDVLLEVEGEPVTIERAIDATGIPRAAFTADRLADFVVRFEARTGQRAALCERELRGDYPYRIDDA